MDFSWFDLPCAIAFAACVWALWWMFLDERDWRRGK